MIAIKEIKSKQKFVSFVKYYKDYAIIPIFNVYIFILYAQFCSFKFPIHICMKICDLIINRSSIDKINPPIENIHRCHVCIYPLYVLYYILKLESLFLIFSICFLRLWLCVYVFPFYFLLIKFLWKSMKYPPKRLKNIVLQSQINPERNIAALFYLRTSLASYENYGF